MSLQAITYCVSQVLFGTDSSLLLSCSLAWRHPLLEFKNGQNWTIQVVALGIDRNGKGEFCMLFE